MVEPDKIKIVCFSDTHSQHHNLDLGSGDILIHSGDFSVCGYNDEISEFNKFLAKQDFTYKIVIAGNHELTFDEGLYQQLLKTNPDCEALSPTDAKAMLTDCIYLENTGVELFGYKFWGSPITPEYYDWAFMKKRGEDIDSVWKLIPSDTDVLITHGPPMGVLDKSISGEHTGCDRLLYHVVERVKPIYHIFGHIHESSGTFSFEIEKGKVVNFINASTCNYQHKPVNQIYTFYLDKKN
jgi:hypothetical protein